MKTLIHPIKEVDNIATANYVLPGSAVNPNSSFIKITVMDEDETVLLETLIGIEKWKSSYQVGEPNKPGNIKFTDLNVHSYVAANTIFYIGRGIHEEIIFSSDNSGRYKILVEEYFDEQ